MKIAALDTRALGNIHAVLIISAKVNVVNIGGD